MPKERGTDLYVGLDDSNHAGKRGGEIIVAIFSTLHEDSFVQHFPNRRNYRSVNEWLDHPERSYKFTVLTHDLSASTRYNLVWVAPFLIEGYLRENFPENSPRSLHIFLDGEIAPSWARVLRQDFTGVPYVDVSNFTGESKRHCPRLSYMADVHASQLFKNHTLDNLLKKKELITIPLENLINRRNLLQR